MMSKVDEGKGITLLNSLEKIIFNLNQHNIIDSIEKFKNLNSLLISNYPISFNIFISQMIYLAFITQKRDINIYLNFINDLDDQLKNNIFDSFIKILMSKFTQESIYILEKMFQKNLISKKILISTNSLYFLHHMSNHKINKLLENSNFRYEIIENYKELSNNDWEFHKKLIEDGVNPNEIAKIIRNDEIEKLQEISSQINFDFNQTIEPSLYERYSFINQEKVTLIDYAAFFGSIKCFKYLLINGANVEKTSKYSVVGGNKEIIHLCEQNHLSFKNECKIAIKYHQNDIFKYIYEQFKKNYEINKLTNFCIKYHNYEILLYLNTKKYIIKEVLKNGNLFILDDIMNKYEFQPIDFIFSIKSRNIELIKLLILQKGFNINIKNKTNKTPLIIACEKGYTEIVKLLLEQENININAVDDIDRSALEIALYNNYFEIVKLLLEQENIKLDLIN